MDGSPTISPAELVAAAVAAVPRSMEYDRLLAGVRLADEEAEQAMVLIRELTAAPESGDRDDRLQKARIARVHALERASRARVTLAPLAEKHRARIAAALEPLANQAVEEISRELDAMVERLTPAIAQHNAIAGAISMTGAAARFGLSTPRLLDGFERLLGALARYADSRAKAAAGGRRGRGLFGRSR